MDIGQFFQQQIKISQLEDELSQSRQTRRYATPTLTLRNHNAILELTAELFPKAKITVSEESDPEIEDDEYFVITVETPGSVGELVKCHREWHCRIVKVAQETAIAYRLSLDIND